MSDEDFLAVAQHGPLPLGVVVVVVVGEV